MLHLAVLASGRGSNLLAIQERIAQGRVAARIALVLCNDPEAPVVSLARDAGLPVWTRPHAAFPSRADFDAAMLGAMANAGVDAVALAGYMRLLSPVFVRAYAGRILNIHPSLLPAFAGADGVADALAHGAKFAGCTVHIVTEEMDAGPIVIQAALPVHEGEDREGLHARIQMLEHRIYPQAVQWLAQGRLRREGRVVRLSPLCGAEDIPGRAAAGTCPGSPERFAGDSEFPACLISPPLEEGF